jgi:hypothetical protein
MEPSTTTAPDPLALAIRNDLAREATNRQEWIAIQLDLCRDLHAARGRFGSHQDFGRWFDQYVGDAIGSNERAAYIGMGAHLGVAKEVLTMSGSSSIQTIYRKDFLPRFTSSSKTVRPRKPQVTDEYEAAMGVIERRAINGESLAYQDIQQEAGISSTAVRRALAVWDAKQEHASDFGKFLSSSATEKLEAAIRQHKKKLDQEFEARIHVEVNRIINEEVLPRYGDKLAKADAIIAADNRRHTSLLFPLSPAQYKAILAALHPDNSTSPERRAELFQLFKSKEDRLKSPVDTDARLAAAGLPRNLDELMARRNQVQAERRAKRKPKS